MEKSFLIRMLNEGRRLDREGVLEFRQPLKVEYGVTSTAEGSAKVTIGNTEVLAGVKLEIGTPYPDRPDEGTIQVGAELVPLSNPEFESGPPSIQAVELARVVDRGIRESKALDFKSLCIAPREKAWIVVIDIVPLNDDGNLIDASALAVLAAIIDTRFPVLSEEGVIDYKSKTDKKLKLSCLPIAVTVYKVGNQMLIDPTREEEKVADARLTISVMDNGNLCTLQKGGDAPLAMAEVENMIDIASEKTKALRNAL